MTFVAVQDVNVVRDFWDWAFGIAGVLGAFAAAWAIVYTTRAKRDAIDERRRLFELDILREIATGVDNGFLFEIANEPRRLRIFARRMDLLPGSVMPFWRVLMDMQWRDEVSAYVGFKGPFQAKNIVVFKAAKRLEGLSGVEEEAARSDHDRLLKELQRMAFDFEEGVSDRLRKELVDAITMRVEAGRFKASRRRWFGVRRKPVGHVD